MIHANTIDKVAICWQVRGSAIDDMLRSQGSLRERAKVLSKLCSERVSITRYLFLAELEILDHAIEKASW